MNKLILNTLLFLLCSTAAQAAVWQLSLAEAINNPKADRPLSLLIATDKDSAAHFDRTGTIWEFYHPHGGPPESVQRKPASKYHAPCRDYLGHNPLLALARLQARLSQGHRGDAFGLLTGPTTSAAANPARAGQQ